MCERERFIYIKRERRSINIELRHYPVSLIKVQRNLARLIAMTSNWCIPCEFESGAAAARPFRGRKLEQSAVTGAGHLLPSYLLSFISLQLQSALLAIQFNLSLIFAAPTCSEATTLSFPPFTPFYSLLLFCLLPVSTHPIWLILYVFRSYTERSATTVKLFVKVFKMRMTVDI